MAQQTINVGASPNDGTGTPLRTAFQYTNSNFTELYTAVGPSGNNIVVPGSATISGDLTVDTSTLKVDSANNRVGIGTATPTVPLDVVGIGGAIFNRGSANQYRLQIGNSNKRYGLYVDLNANNTDYFAIYDDTAIQQMLTYVPGASGSWTHYINGSTAMTLNSTGLGVGMSPSAILSVLKSSATQATGLILRNGNGSDGSSISLDFETSSGTSGIEASLAGRISGRRAGAGTTGALDFFVTSAGTLGSAKMTIDGTGNVGIGVTPKTWASTYRSLSFPDNYAIIAGDNGNGVCEITSNAYNDGAWKYANAFKASRYQIDGINGQHEWYTTSTTGTVGGTISWTQAMTLTATGDLLVGTTNTSTTAGVGLKSLYNATVPSLSMVVNDAAGTGAAYLLYNTNAAAYRFYVANSGTIFATNTTISAISDARLKENVQDIDVGLGAILALKPRKFDWKAGKGKDIKGDRGFIAQEFETVFPNLIDEWKDAAPEGEAPYKSVRQDLIPVLVKAIQELTARVQTLEAK